MNRQGLISPLSPRLPAGPGDRVSWTGLYGSSAALAVARAASDHAGPVLVLAPDAPAAQRLEEQIQFFLPADGSLPLISFPDWETLPWDVFSPHQDIVSERLAALRRLPEIERGVLVVPVATAMVRICPPAYLDAHGVTLATGDTIVLETFRRRLESAGYTAVGQVMEHGEFAIRGSLLDLYPMGSDLPLRIDLLGDEVDTIRRFDPETQRSVDRIETVDTLPAREFPMTEEAIARFRGAWRARFEGDPTRSPVYRAVSDGISPAGIEYYLPLFFDETARLVDYLPESCLTVVPEATHGAAEGFWSDLGERYEEHRHDPERPLLSPAEVFVPPAELFEALAAMGRVRIGGSTGLPERGRVAYGTRGPEALPVDGRAADPLAFVKRFIDGFPGRVLFAAETAGRQEILLETFAGHGLRPARSADWHRFLAAGESLAITVAPIDEGMVVDDPPVALVTESQLFGERAMQRRRRKTTQRDEEAIIRDLAELNVGAPVVHERYGVGRYLGLENLTVGGQTSEFLALEYADGDRLYVPVLSLHLISRYSGVDPEHAPLHKLGTSQWQKARRKAAERVRDVAAELLEVQARRAARPGHAFTVADGEYRAFAQAFPFEETPDQQETIDAVLDDLRSDKAMDRLVCGDVGFGKTEVAMRAAFVAVQDGWQVAVLVPTTLLAQQHHRTFSDRFADWPVTIEQLSRFRSKKQRDEVVERLAAGRLDIVIGTHKLLQGDIGFRRLGLAIIDEEHRFGVRQKEKLKALRAEVDVLTLTATPIPRTLNMALAELRDLSLIGTPPERRLSIKTFVREWNDGLLREACLREIRRGGQIYLVHNRVEDIERVEAEIHSLVPEAETRIAHGQMRERDLERVMLDFYHRRFNLLVCTTIIETGIDVPNANTIIINRADRFGLAQLHQLRGRVGRSHHRAYAYLVVPQRRAMTADAIKRLEAIESLEDLGIGFSLATHDLEIRGAGELLGDEQSGQMHEVGYALYTRLLERTVAALRAGRSPELDRPLDHGTEIDLRVPALIPDDYLPDIHTRLIMYKRIASAPSPEALRDLQVEMIDRFGLLPEPAQALFRITGLKLAASPLGVRKIDVGAEGGRLTFHENPEVDPARIIRLIQSEPGRYRLDGADRLRITMALPDLDSRIAAVSDLLETLAARDAA